MGLCLWFRHAASQWFRWMRFPLRSVSRSAAGHVKKNASLTWIMYVSCLLTSFCLASAVTRWSAMSVFKLFAVWMTMPTTRLSVNSSICQIVCWLVTLTIVVQDTLNHCAFVGQVQSKHSDTQSRQGSRLFFRPDRSNDVFLLDEFVGGSQQLRNDGTSAVDKLVYNITPSRPQNIHVTSSARDQNICAHVELLIWLNCWSDWLASSLSCLVARHRYKWRNVSV